MPLKRPVHDFPNVFCGKSFRSGAMAGGTDAVATKPKQRGAMAGTEVVADPDAKKDCC